MRPGKITTPRTADGGIVPRTGPTLGPVRRILVVRTVVALLFIAAVVAGCGGRDAGSADDPASESPVVESADTTGMSAFSGMRPRSGDQMVRPRIGFRWEFDPTRAPGDSLESFVLHIRGSDDFTVLEEEVEGTEVQVTVGDEFPLGECTWWVEARMTGAPPLRSPITRFALLP